MRSLLVIAAVVAGAASLTAIAGASEATATFACPKDTSREPIGRIYGANRGSTFCNDGATATAIVGGTKLSFTGGVCWKDSASILNVSIGTSIAGKRRATDPPGFWLIDQKPGGIVKDSAEFGKGSTSWGHTVVIKYKADRRSGTFSGTEPRLAGGKLTYVKASGTFACKRVLTVPL
jgi:hypothetical protein